MTPRIHVIAPVAKPQAALYAMRTLIEPVGFQVVEGTGGDAEALRGENVVLWSYGPRPLDLPARAHLHVSSCDDLWSSPKQPASLPARPFHRMSAPDLGLDGPLPRPAPLPFVVDARNGCMPPTQVEPGRIVTGADIVASAFYFLTRYEETYLPCRDRFGRVEEDRLSLVTEGLADRAPVDEYREVLASWLSRLLGRPIAPHPPGYEVLLTHDVDSGFRVTRGPFWSHVLRGMARDIVRRRSPRTALELGVNASALTLGGDIPFGSVTDILRMAERHGRTSHFFFMANGTHPDDAAYDIRALRTVLRTIVDAGHRVGLHVGLDAADDWPSLRREWDLLSEVLGRAPSGARTHFLRFDPWRTPRLLEAVGACFDSSAAFSLRCGFRSGTTRPHRLYDLEAGRVLDLWEYPLAIMDKAVYDLPPAARRDAVARVVSAVRRHGGCLTINWHYWYFTHRYRRMCEEILAACNDGRDATPVRPEPAHTGGSEVPCPS